MCLIWPSPSFIVYAFVQRKPSIYVNIFNKRDSLIPRLIRFAKWQPQKDTFAYAFSVDKQNHLPFTLSTHTHTVEKAIWLSRECLHQQKYKNTFGTAIGDMDSYRHQQATATILQPTNTYTRRECAFQPQCDWDIDRSALSNYCVRIGFVCGLDAQPGIRIRCSYTACTHTREVKRAKSGISACDTRRAHKHKRHTVRNIYTRCSTTHITAAKKKKIQNKYEKHQLVDYRTVTVACMGCLCMRSIAQNGNAQCVNIHIDTMCRVWSYIYAIFVCVWAVYIGDYGGCAEGHDATSLALENVYWQRFSIIINVTHSIGDYYEYQTRGVGMSVKFAALLWHFFRIFILFLFNIF